MIIEVRRTPEFDTWLRRLKDRQARTKILVRLDRLSNGNPGDVRSLGAGLSEMRIDYGPGYRVYYTQRGPVLVIVLCGGDKSSQEADIRRAEAISDGLEG